MYKRQAFADCYSLIAIDLPASLTELNEGAFSGCHDLESIDVAENNPAYASQNGVLFTKDGSRLLRCPNSFEGEYIFPEGVKELGDYAFEQCSHITSIDVPGGVVSIGKYAFDGCSALTSLSIPDTVTSMGAWALDGCENLKAISVVKGSYAESWAAEHGFEVVLSLIHI